MTLGRIIEAPDSLVDLCAGADAAEVAAGLSLLCAGSKSSKLAVAWELFADGDKWDGALSRRGLWRYVRSFLATLLAVASLPDGAAGDAAVRIGAQIKFHGASRLTGCFVTGRRVRRRRRGRRG
jgi:hypothetical protein